VQTEGTAPMEMTRCLGRDWFPARGQTRQVGCSMQEVDVWLARRPRGPLARICGCKSAREMKSDFVSGEPSSHSARHASAALLAHAQGE
jgi:hypothetical protein